MSRWNHWRKVWRKSKVMLSIFLHRILNFSNCWSSLFSPALFDQTCVQIFRNITNIGFCPPPFRRKAEGHSFWHSVLSSVLPSVRPSIRPSFRPPNIVGTLCAQLLLQFYADSFETLQMFLSWSEDMHVGWILS